MLHFSSASHNAFQPPPPRGRGIFSWSDAERRLLSFANGTGSGGTGTPLPEPNEPKEQNQPNQPSESNQPNEPTAPIQTQTRTDTQQTLENPQEVGRDRSTFVNSLRKGIETLQDKLRKTQQKTQDLQLNYRDIMPDTIQTQLRKANAFLSIQLGQVEQWAQTVQIIEEFRSGKKSPAELVNWIGTYIQNSGEQGPEQERWKATLASLNQHIANRKTGNPLTDLALNKMERGDQWQMQQASTQIEIDQEIQKILEETEKIVPIDSLLAFIHTNRRIFEDQIIQDGLDKMNTALKEMEQNLEQAKKEQANPQKKQGLLDAIGIKFYSPLEIWEAFKMLKEAWTENFKQRTRLKAAGLAQSAGNVLQVLPYGQGINEILESQNDKANNDIKDGYMSFLKNSYTSFNALFSPGGELDRNKQDINRSRAVLEYAASRGWLWDINESSSNDRVVAGHKLDDFLPTHWSEQRRSQYFLLLKGQNSSGGSKEKQEGKSRVETAEEISEIIPDIAAEMQGRNFWAVTGMAEAAMAKGKLGEVSPWVAATIFNEMRKGDTMKYMSKDMIDQLGGLGLGHPGFTLQTFKTERRQWYDWRAKRQAGLDVPPEEINNFTRAFATAEKEFADVDNEQERMRLIAKVLAGQVVEYNGRKYSIFNAKYKFYREPMIKQVYEGEFDSKKSDPDFFGAESEVILYGPKAIADLLTISNQKFLNATKATNTLGNILARYDQLVAAGLRDDAKEYQSDMCIKFHAYLRQGTINDTRTEAMAETTVTPKSTKIEEKAFSGLVKRGLIEKKELEKLIKEHNAGNKHRGIDTFKKILQQVDPDNPLVPQSQGGGGGGGEGAE